MKWLIIAVLMSVNGETATYTSQASWDTQAECLAEMPMLVFGLRGVLQQHPPFEAAIQSFNADCVQAHNEKGA